ncbi:MAG TPA: methyl-accepting chemotaxis protein [Myxococcota bacterium]|nr:methyl-accepting chemotaxis protein [Myxococcota bacterium]
MRWPKDGKPHKTKDGLSETQMPNSMQMRARLALGAVLIGIIPTASVTALAIALSDGSLTATLVGVTVAWCAVLTAIAYAASGRITAPLRKVTVAAQHIANGDLDHSIEHHGDDEVGELTDSVRSIQASVRRLNDTVDAIVEPMREAGEVLEAVARYDLRVKVEGAYSGDHARMKEAVNSSQQALHDVISQMTISSEFVAHAAGEISSGSQAIAEGATVQAASLEETAASLEEISGMTRQNADSTMKARALALSTKDTAESGEEAVAEMVEAMGKIRASASNTSQILKDINQIAFQTNLLALNAAVEAARAGDAGRGFAVVAEEVRALALRSKEAAEKTELLVSESVGLAQEGEQLSKRVNEQLSDITSSVGEVAGIVAEIASASDEQARGIEQVARAVHHMDQVVQNAAGASEESSSAAEEVHARAAEMADVVRRFKLDSDNVVSLPSRAARRPVAREPKTRVGGLLHYMLPLSSINPARAREAPGTFADTGVPMLFRELFALGAVRTDLVIKIAGGASLCGHMEMFAVGKRNLQVLKKMFEQNGYRVSAHDIGGSRSRTLRLGVGDGRVVVSSPGMEVEL